MSDVLTLLTNLRTRNDSLKPKRVEHGYVCECKICLNHTELERIESLLPKADADKLRNMWENMEQASFDMNWDLCNLEDRWQKKYNELESRLNTVLLI